MIIVALHTRALVASSGAVILGAVLTGCGSTDPGDAPAEHKSFALSGRTLTVESGNTALEIEPADVRKVEVTRRVDGWVVAGNGPDPQWGMEDGTLTLKVKCRALISDCAARHQVKVPRGVAVVIKNGNGKVTASGFDTSLTLNNRNGGVTVRNSSGKLALETHNGAITAEGISAKSVSARSENGSMRLDFSSVPDLVETRAHNGSTVIGLPNGSTTYAVSAAARNGHVSVEAPRSDDSPHVVKASSNNGRITVRSAN
ncbi:DUF4097 family beta strand repeat-containing protein [Streptomyces sp. NPDC014734]|uniref:DUF4097 family beta strand repeat-containing protein n=1 Tax=Streptomyces sp. NPDC014734 TaxID=3364886 RepID=UPI0036FD0834